MLACLGEAGPQAHVALPALEKLLDDPEPGTRATVVRAILQIEDNLSPPAAGGMAAWGVGRANPQRDDKLSPRLTAVMLEMIADKKLAQEWRMEIMGKIKEIAPTALAKATPGLIRQLGDSNADVRRAALDLLQIIIEDTPAELPGHEAAR